MGTDPLYYLSQVVLFVAGSVLVGFFIRQFHVEIVTEGWVVTPRSIWFACLVASSLSFVIYYFDPNAILGIYTAQWALFLAWFATSLFLNSVACTLYMYVIVLYKQHLQNVPPILTKIWLFSNLCFSFFLNLGGVIGTLSNNVWWYGLLVILIILQELVMAVVLNVSLHKITQVLNKLAEATGDSFRSTIRKMWIFRIASTLIALTAIANQLIGSEDAVVSLASWGDVITLYPLDEFDVTSLVPDLLLVLGHCLLLYSLRRPQSKEELKVSRMQNSVNESNSRRSNLQKTKELTEI